MKWTKYEKDYRVPVKSWCAELEEGALKQAVNLAHIDPKVFFKSSAVFKKLPDMYRELAALRKELDELKGKVKE